VNSPNASHFSKRFLRLFFSLYFVLGLGLIGLTPPFQSPDAFAHFDRAFGIAQGQITTTTSEGVPGNVFPVGVYQMEVIFSGMAAGPAARVSKSEFVYGWHQTWNSPKYFTAYDTGGNAPFLYIPQALGIAIGRILSGHLLVGYYLAEIMNLLAFSVLTRWAMAQLPKRLGFPLGVFLLLPMVYSLAISVNPDCLLLALSTVFAASCYNRYREAREPSATSTSTPSKRAAVLHPWNIWPSSSDRIGYLSLLFVTIEKPPMVILGLLLPIADLSLSVRRYVLRSIVVTGSAIAAYEVWARFLTGSPGKASPVTGVAPARQLELVLTNPVKDFDVVTQTLRINGLLYCKEFIAGIGWLDTWFAGWFYQGVGAIFILAVVSAITLRRRRAVRTLWSLLVLALAASALMFTFYLVDTPYSNPTITGFQGRYLLPLLPSLLVVLGWQSDSISPRTRLASNVVREYAATALVGLQLWIYTDFVITVLHRYWT
jgi:uncharacterized membrane protein